MSSLACYTVKFFESYPHVRRGQEGVAGAERFEYGDIGECELHPSCIICERVPVSEGGV